MAYEPGGGTGEPYSRYEDLSFKPGYSIQEWLKHLMEQGNVGVAQPMGTGIRDFMQDQMYGRDQPSDLQINSPQDYIRQMLEEQQQGPPGNENADQEYQVAGDVMKMRSHQPTESGINMRLQSPGVGARSQGMQSIERFGGPQNPYLDLLDILMYPQGGQIRK